MHPATDPSGGCPAHGVLKHRRYPMQIILNFDFFVLLSIIISCAGSLAEIIIMEADKKYFYSLSRLDLNLFSLSGTIIGIAASFLFNQFALIGVYFIMFAYFLINVIYAATKS